MVKIIVRLSLFVIFLIFILFVIKLFAFDLYRISSKSIDAILLNGDLIVLNKLEYGPRFLNFFKYLNENSLDFYRIKGVGGINRNDLMVFNLPKYIIRNDTSNMHYNIYTRRCVAISGDTMLIKNGDIYNNGLMSFTCKQSRDEIKYCDCILNKLFPFKDKNTWRLENYGPLIIPQKGKCIKLSHDNFAIYKEVIEFERNSIQYSNDSIFVGNEINKYTFKKNYYFMIGDDFYSSHDSRYWGFIPEEYIIGKVGCILFSVNPTKTGWNQIRKNRICKKI